MLLLEMSSKTKKPCVATWHAYCMVWLGFPVHDLPGMAAQVIIPHLDSFYISADRAVWGKTLGDKGSLARFYRICGRCDSN